MEDLYHLEKNYARNPMQFEDMQLYQIGRKYCQKNSIVPAHIHTNLYELTIVTDGAGEILTNGVPTQVSRGDIYLSLPGDAHEIRSDSENALVYDFFAFTVKNENFQREMEYIMEHYYSPMNRVFRDERVRLMVGDAIAEVNGDRLYSSELLGSMFRQILIHLIRGFRKIPPDKYLETVTSAEVLCYRLMHYIDTHIYSMKNLDELSEITDYSYGYLSSLFKKTTAQTLSHYYQEKKLDVAQLLISQNRHSITEVSEMLNYASVYSFSKAFHKRFGISPRAFRARKDGL